MRHLTTVQPRPEPPAPTAARTRSAAWLVSLVVAALMAMLVVPVHAAYLLRYSTVAKGSVLFAGNTLGLGKAAGSSSPGTSDAIGVFTSLDSSQAVTNWSTATYGYTTRDWTKNGSTGQARIPTGASVLYAELIWGGSYKFGSEAGYSDVSSSITATAVDRYVTLCTPANPGGVAVYPDTATAKDTTAAAGATQCYYVRSQDVTNLVQQGGAGVYSVKHVAASIAKDNDSSNCAGWTLAVVYADPAETVARDLSIFVGCEWVQASPVVSAIISGFCTPASGTVNARIAVTALEGDPAKTGDAFQVQKADSSWVSLGSTVAQDSNSRNLPTNFFASQICDQAGHLDTTGTAGSHNAAAGTAVAGARQGWDITDVAVPATVLGHSQTSLNTQGITTSENYAVAGIGLQVDVGAPIFPLNVVTVDHAQTFVGDTLTYTVRLDNTAGGVDATGVVMKADLPYGMEFVPGSVNVGRTTLTPRPTDDVTVGVPIGTVGHGDYTQATFQTRVKAIPMSPRSASYTVGVYWDYDYSSCIGLPPNHAVVYANQPVVVPSTARLDPTKASSPAVKLAVGDTVTYTVTVPNTADSGASPTAGATLYDPIPPGLTYVPGSTKPNGSLVSDVSGDMPFSLAGGHEIHSPSQLAGVIVAQAAATVTYQAKVGQNPPDSITNTAYADPDGAGPAPARTAAVSNPPVKADMAVAISNGGTTAVPGTQTTYTIVVKNNGPDTPSSATLEVALPAGLSRATYAPSAGAFDPSTGAWTGIPLAAGASVTLAVSGVLQPGLTGTITASAQVAAQAGFTDSTSANDSATDTDTLTPQANLVVTKSDGQASVLPNTAVTYTVTVVNEGPSTVTSARLTETHGADLVIGAITPSEGMYFAYDTNSGGWTGLTLAPFESATLTVSATVGSPTGTLTNTALVSPAGGVTETDAADNTSTDTDVVGVSGSTVSGRVYLDSNHDSQAQVTEGAPCVCALSTVWVKLVRVGQVGTVVAQVAVPVDSATGEWIYTWSSAGHVGAGTYDLILDTNSTLSDVTPSVPSVFIGVNPVTLSRRVTFVANTNYPNQLFGLWQGGTVQGTVFRDDGAGGQGVANDGRVNGAEAGLPGATVTLADTSLGTTADAATTSSDGGFTLWYGGDSIGHALALAEANPRGFISTGGSAGTTTAPGTYVRVTDTISFTGAGARYTDVAFGDVPNNVFIGEGSKTTEPGGIAIYPHTYAVGTAGSLTFDVQDTASPAAPPWRSVLYLDSGGNGLLDSIDPIITGPLVVTAATGSLQLLLKVMSPLAGGFGATDTSAIAAQFTYANAAPPLSVTLSRTDLTALAGTPGLQLDKSADKTLAKPGEIITYTIRYTNLGPSALSQVQIADATPAYTVFSAASSGALPSNLTGCSIAQPAVGQGGGISWTFAGTLSPSSTGTVSYAVLVQ